MNITKLQSASAVQAAMKEYDQIGRTRFLEKYGFGKSRDFMLRDTVTGNLYDSKAIVGAAYGYAFPEEGPLPAKIFSEDETLLEPALTRLGFEMVRIGQDWSIEEVQATVRDYFEMLKLDSSRRVFSKAEHNEALRAKLPTRTKAAIELKHQNISAVLKQLELPYIPGYKPRGNLQGLLREEVLKYIDRNKNTLNQIMNNLDAQTTPGNQQYVGVLVVPPQVEPYPDLALRARLPKKLDYAARDEANRKLGHGGESWTMGYEDYRLTKEGRPDLVNKIDWVSDRLGDGLGYDIQSCETTEADRFIEVKTTNGGSLTPFIITRNELEVSEEKENAYCLYRIFEFATSPRLFILQGSLSSILELNPISYRARLKSIR